MDEIDAIGGRRFSEGTSADREIQRTLMELLNQMDGFDRLGQVKMIMATNRPDVLDPALLRPGRLDRKIGKLSPILCYQVLMQNCVCVYMCVYVCVRSSRTTHLCKRKNVRIMLLRTR